MNEIMSGNKAVIDYNRNRIPVSKDFTLREFECRGIRKGIECCGGLSGVHPATLNPIQLMRDYINKPLIINSGHRCRIYNKHIGGAKNSRHIKLLAVDVSCRNTGLEPEEMADLFVCFGVVRTIIYIELQFVHIEGYDRYTVDGTRYKRKKIVDLE